MLFRCTCLYTHAHTHTKVESDYSDEEGEKAAKRAAKKVPAWASKDRIREALRLQVCKFVLVLPRVGLGMA